MNDASATILVIEDDPAIRLGLKKSLAFEGYTVIDAADGEQGLERVFERRPDLIVLDLMLPRVNGYEVCRTIRKHDRTIPILILSAKDLESDMIMGLDLGADDYITKPFSTRELSARIKAALRRTAVQEDKAEVYEFRHIAIDIPGQTLRVHDRPVEV
ncbi:MAG: response regulator, partial [Planctomycetota bacterium]|nr:response regulator [Planctomycetota bacterium]